MLYKIEKGNNKLEMKAHQKKQSSYTFLSQGYFEIRCTTLKSLPIFRGTDQ